MEIEETDMDGTITKGFYQNCPQGISRRIIELFQREALSKHLMLHHEMREQNILYRILDKITEEVCGSLLSRRGSVEATEW